LIDIMTGEIAYRFDVPSAAMRASAALRLLVVEDDEIYADLVCMMSSRLGVAADKARGWPEASVMLAQANRKGAPYLLVLMDLMMPGIDGIEATRLLREKGWKASDLPVIALSGLSGTSEVERFIAAGGQTAIAKPIALEAFSALLKEWLPLGQTNQAPVRVEDAGLVARYLERKLAALAAIDAALSAGDASSSTADSIQGMLHQLAGVAGFFGDKLLSNLASACDAALLAAEPGKALDVLTRYRSRIANACR
jgi:CheY-like chemotaxis protein